MSINEINGPIEMAARLLSRLNNYEKEARTMLECYDRLEQENDGLKARCQQYELENTNLKIQLSMLMAEKSSKDYSRVHRVVGSQSQVIGSPQNRPRSSANMVGSGIKQFDDEMIDRVHTKEKYIRDE